MKRLMLGVIAGALLYGQAARTLTVTIPADVARAFEKAQRAEYQQNKELSLRLRRPMTEKTDPSKTTDALAAEIATLIADKVFRYVPSDAPPRQGNEAETDRRNRYQNELRSKIKVK